MTCRTVRTPRTRSSVLASPAGVYAESEDTRLLLPTTGTDPAFPVGSRGTPTRTPSSGTLEGPSR